MEKKPILFAYILIPFDVVFVCIFLCVCVLWAHTVSFSSIPCFRYLHPFGDIASQPHTKLTFAIDYKMFALPYFSLSLSDFSSKFHSFFVINLSQGLEWRFRGVFSSENCWCHCQSLHNIFLFCQFFALGLSLLGSVFLAGSIPFLMLIYEHFILLLYNTI